MHSMSMFPYPLVPRGSRIILYGAGNIGKDFYLQLHYSNYCNLVAWIDREFDTCEVLPPFAEFDSINKFEYDYVVIAIRDSETAEGVIKDLMEKGIPHDRIVWSSTYYGVDHSVFPLCNIDLAKSPEFYLGILDEQIKVQSKYGGLGFYQSFYEIGFPGSRNSGERILLYRLHNFLKKTDTVLDIGCNCGFFDIQISSLVKYVYGIDIEQGFIEVANRAKEYLGVNNVQFKSIDFYEERLNKKFNVVFSFAVHELMLERFTEEEYVSHLTDILESEGLLFFESHDTRTDRERFYRLCNLFMEKGFKELYRFEYSDYPSGINRIIVVMRGK